VSRAEADRGLASRIGQRIRAARARAGLTQAQVAGDRYTKAYVSALENGLVKPSMAALNYLAGRLGVPVEQLVADSSPRWTRLEADLRLASGDWLQAADAFAGLLEEAASDAVRAEALAGLAEAEARLGRATEAIRHASEAAALFTALHRPADAARCAYWEAFGLYELELGDQAHALLDRTLTAIIGLEVEPDLPVRILIAMATVANRDQEPERALGYLEQARARIPELEAQKRARFLYSLALSYRELGDYEAAISAGSQSLAGFRATESRSEVAALENELALVHLARGSLESARSHAAAARSELEALGATAELAHVRDTIAQIELAAGSLDVATREASEAAELARVAGNRKAEVSATLSLARALRASGDLEGAARTLEAAAATARELGRRRQLQAVLGEWSEVVAETGDLRRAYELSREALQAGRA
jgi:transcriptional regulator with XRE-family HTH domain